jgi:GTP-sensing pleiotropic transcriptional regulator CodY
MELKEKITLDMLTKDSVSVLRQKFVIIDGTEMQVGGNVRNAYMNCENDKEILKAELSEEYYNAVMAVWEV